MEDFNVLICSGLRLGGFANPHLSVLKQIRMLVKCLVVSEIHSET